jgi:hypothetical protein
MTVMMRTKGLVGFSKEMTLNHSALGDPDWNNGSYPVVFINLGI